MDEEITLEMLKASATTKNRVPEWNEWLITNINDLGIIQVSQDFDLVSRLGAFILLPLFFISIYFACKNIKKEFDKNREELIEELNSCFNFYMEAFLDNKEFRNWTLKLSSGMLIISSICGALFGSAMFGFIVGLGLLCALLHGIYVGKYSPDML